MDGVEFIKQKYLSLNRNPNKIIYFYEVCAIIPSQVEKIMDEVQDIIIKQSIER